MHVLLLGPYPPPEGGISRNMLAIRDELLAAGDRCSIIATSKSTRIGNEPDVYHPRTPFELVKLLRSLDHDILHLHVGGDISRRVLSLIFVCSLFGRGRNILSLHSGGYSETAEGKAANRYSIRASLFRRFSRIIAVNPLLADVFERYGVEKDKIRVINPFVPRLPDPTVEIPHTLERFASQHTPFLLTVGQLENEYDLMTQIDAMEKVLNQLPDAGLMIVGSGSLEEKLEEAIASKRYSANIFLAGDVEHAVTLHMINRADILLRTTLYDGDAISVREALYLGTHVIATDNKMRPKNVTLMTVGDSKALSEKIIRLASAKKPVAAARTEDVSNVKRVLELYGELET